MRRMDGRCWGRWLGLFCLLTLVCVWGCSKRERARRALERAETLLLAGDVAWENGEKEALGSYEEAAALAGRAENLLGEEHPVSVRSKNVRELALLKARTCKEPEALVQLLLKVMGEGDSQELKRLVLLGRMAEESIEPRVWERLSEQARERWIHCCETVVDTWLQGTADYWRAMQWTVDSVETKGDTATVIMTWRSTLGEADIHIQCVDVGNSWRVLDFFAPTLNSGLSIYMTEMVREILKTHSDLGEFLSLEEAERLCVEAFHAAERRIRTMEQDFVGKKVRLKAQEAEQYDVLDQSRRDGEWWVLLRTEDEEGGPSRWVPASLVERVEEEDLLWGLQ